MVDTVNIDNLETLPYDPGMAHEMVKADKDGQLFQQSSMLFAILKKKVCVFF